MYVRSGIQILHQSSYSLQVFHQMDRYHVSPPQAIDRWPGRDELLKLRQQNSELVLRNCVDIIDYFKNFIERPTNLMVRAQT